MWLKYFQSVLDVRNIQSDQPKKWDILENCVSLDIFEIVPSDDCQSFVLEVQTIESHQLKKVRHVVSHDCHLF